MVMQKLKGFTIPDKYDLSAKEYGEIKKKSKDSADLVYTGYRYGFMRGRESLTGTLKDMGEEKAELIARIVGMLEVLPETECKRICDYISELYSLESDGTSEKSRLIGLVCQMESNTLTVFMQELLLSFRSKWGCI